MRSMFSQRINKALRVPRPSSSPPPARWRAFVCRPSGRHCIHEAHFRHRGASVSGFLRPSATVAAWQPGPAARSGGRHRFRQASSPPVQARQSAATFPVSPPPAFIHARSTAPPNCFCPLFGVNRPGCVPRRSGSRLVILNPTKLQQEAATAPDKSVTVATRSASRQFSSNSPPSHQR